MSNLKKRVLSFCLSIVFVLAALAVPLTTGAEETGHFCFELPNDCFHCADHDAADVCDEKIGTEYTPRIIYDCGCSSANAGTYTTNTNSGNVNIRAGHSTNTAIIGQIPRGTYFTVDFASSAWAHVNYNGTIGYVSMSVIKKVSGNTNPSCGCSTANAGTYTTNTNGGDVNIRAGHSTNTDVIDQIPCGSSFTVTHASSTWAHVTYGVVSGYVSMSVIKYAPYTFSIKSYVDQGFLKRFSNAEARVVSYSNTVKLKLQAVFPVSVNVQTVEAYTSYCDECKDQIYGRGNWSSYLHLQKPCPHTSKEHLASNPDKGTGIMSRGYYFDFIRKNGVGTKRLTKVMWTGHIAYEKDVNGNLKLARPQAVPYYDDGHIKAWHNIVLMPPSDVVNASNGYSNLANAVVESRYESTLLHELSHTLGAPDHYSCWGPDCSCNSPYTCGKSHVCKNSGCWKCHQNLYIDAGGICIMNYPYNMHTTNINKLYCPQCLELINDHLRDHH